MAALPRFDSNINFIAKVAQPLMESRSKSAGTQVCGNVDTTLSRLRYLVCVMSSVPFLASQTQTLIYRVVGCRKPRIRSSLLIYSKKWQGVKKMLELFVTYPTGSTGIALINQTKTITNQY